MKVKKTLIFLPSKVNLNRSSPLQEASATPLNPLSPDFYPSGQIIVNPPQDNHWIAGRPQENDGNPNASPVFETNEQSFQEVMAKHRQQNEQMIATHKQLAAAMTLPQLKYPSLMESQSRTRRSLWRLRQELNPKQSLQLTDCII